MNKIRSMQLPDVDIAIRIHMEAFHGFFLTFLGSSFLREFYTGVCKDQSGIAIVYADNTILGFVVGTVQPSGFYGRLLQKRWLKFGLAALKPVIRKPSIIPRLLRVLTLPTKTLSGQLKTATLLSLAVLPDFQGRGIGRQLVSSFLEDCRKRQVQMVNLTTDALDNDTTNRFYLKMGFTCERTYATPEGRVMNEYINHL